MTHTRYSSPTRLATATALIVLPLLLLAPSLAAQKLYSTKSGYVSFYSEAPLENIQAENNSLVSVLNVESGRMMFKCPVRAFSFPNKTMQRHFNNQYLHTDEHPYAKFKGYIQAIDGVDLRKPGKHQVTVAGDMTIHGVTRKVKTEGTLHVKDGTIDGQATFPIRVENYNIEIPKMLTRNIAEVVDVTVELTYQPYSQ
jgi:hypothetical protein